MAEHPVPDGDELTTAVIRGAQAGRAGDRQALVERYQRAVFAMVGRMLVPRGRGAQVADLAQETFLRVLRSLPRFDPAGPARLSTWILTIATRAVLDELRRPRLVSATMDEALDVRDASAGRLGDRIADRLALGRALAALDPDQHAVLLLCDAEGFGYEEAAAALGVPVGTVKSRLSRARAAVRDVISGGSHEAG